MIVRSAARRQQRRTARLLSHGFAQLSLPWLAPAQLRWHATHLESPAIPDRPRRRSPSRSQHGLMHTRRLATATDQSQSQVSLQYPEAASSRSFRNSIQDAHVPWQPSQSSKSRLSGIQPAASPIILDFMQKEPEPIIKVIHGVQGTAHDLLQHFHTALQVQRFSRAETIMHRLAGAFPPDSFEMIHAHTAYLEASLVALSLYGRGVQCTQVLRTMQRWFEVEVKGNGVPLSAKILAVMIRASIKALTGKERDRTLKRYLNYARIQGDAVYDEVIDAEEYDDNEFTLLGRVSYSALEENEAKPVDSLVPEESQLATPQPGKLPAPSDSLAGRLDTVRMADIPPVLETAQRGEGLMGVKRNLETFAKIPDLPPDASMVERLEHSLRRQKVMEEASVEVAVDRWRRADEELRRVGINTAMHTRPMNALMWQWYQALVPALEEELKACQELLSKPTRSDHDRYHYGPYLELLSLDKIAVSTILTAMSRLAGIERSEDTKTVEIKIPSLTMSLAKAIEEECSVDAQKQRSVKRSRSGSRGSLSRSRNGKQAHKGANKQESRVNLKWPIEAKVKFGAMLASKLVETAQLPVTRPHPRTKEMITQMQPAFLHRFKWQAGRRVGLMSPNPTLVEKLQSEPVASLLAKRMPMVVEPRPWTGWAEGGYLCYSNPIMRLPTGEHTAKHYFKAAHAKGDMDQIYTGLNTLGEVPWVIQQDVFKVQLEAWNSGEAVGNLAPLHPQFKLPPEPEASAGQNERRKWLEEIREIENRRTGLHSERCFQNFQMEIARTMLNETLYFPHSLDFRGRAYPIPPYLNHMGADNVRGLLVFGNGKKLGATGLRWLKIHLATVAGHDKASMSERLDFTMKHLDDIYDSVRNPLGGRRWWLKAEDCWQTLSACFELTKALDSPDPENFVSHLPIQQDGTCNGLQHYAALGGDKIGAAQVNLEPGDRPADVYTAVAEAVKVEVHEDALKGNPIAMKLDGNLTRKCVKQPVMTNVYGVTWFGAKEQVKKQLEIIFPDVRKFDAVNYNNMSHYVAIKIFKCLGTMFGGAQSIQHWLGQCADRISTALTPEQIEAACKPATEQAPKGKKMGRPKAPSKTKVEGIGSASSDRASADAAKLMFKSTVVWTTPLHLPVVQPYRTSTHRQIKTSMQLISLQEPRSWHPVSKRKQLQAFPPNFIHSLDASHMMLSALRCKEMGMTFASVHDSFWTHACDIDRMGVALRDSFVEMHSDNIISRLKEEFETRYSGYMYYASVKAKTSVGRKITALRKEGKIKPADELALEAKRLRLLRSEDEQERAEGEAMVTPGSILAMEKGNVNIEASAEFRDHRLGSIPKEADAESSAVADASADSSGETDPSVSELSAEAGEGIVGGSALGVDVDAIEPPTLASQAESASTTPKPKKKSYPYDRKVFAWMPLTFPDVPPKGEFDVRKIRESNYFFH